MSATIDRRLDELVDDVLFPAAAATDQADHLPASHFAALAELGLFGMVVGAADGGLGLRPAEVRRVLRRIGSGCGATAFAFAQHHGTVGAVAASANGSLRERWLPALSSDALAGIAYAHVRRPGPPVLRATPANDGGAAWVLDGEAPWVTSWGLAEVLGVAALTDDGRLVWVLVPASESAGMSMVKRFELSVFTATATVAIAFDRYRVEPESVISVVDVGPWSVGDRLRAARPNPLCLGIGDRALALVAAAEPDRGAELAPVWAETVARADEQATAVDDGVADLDTVAAARAETVLATQRLTAALLATVGGRAMERSHPAQRLHREAGFFVVQAQNDAGRRALLGAVARPERQRSP
ncbi:MAG: acyl-CoA dehydrogenase family protein [Actinomycetota bacterium]